MSDSQSLTLKIEFGMLDLCLLTNNCIYTVILGFKWLAGDI